MTAVDESDFRETYQSSTLNNVSKISFLKINNVIYKKGLAIQLDDEELPTFGLINDVFVSDNEIFLGCQIVKSIGFHRNYFGFVVIIEEINQLISLTNTVNSHILHFIYRCDVNILVRSG